MVDGAAVPSMCTLVALAAAPYSGAKLWSHRLPTRASPNEKSASCSGSPAVTMLTRRSDGSTPLALPGTVGHGACAACVNGCPAGQGAGVRAFGSMGQL